MKDRCRKTMARMLFALAGFAWWSAGPAEGAWLYVATNAVSPNDGSDWSKAFANLQAALNAAGSGDTVCVAGHTFGLTTQIVWTTSYVTVRGGYAATNAADTPGPSDPTRWPTALIRTGGAAHRILKINGVTNGTLEQVTMSGGYVTTEGGAGLFVNNSRNVLLSNCTVSNNQSSGSLAGGGIWASSGTDLTLTNCILVGNSVFRPAYSGSAQGGGIAAFGTLTLLQCRVQDNNVTRYGKAGTGGGVFFNGDQMTIRDVLLLSNGSDGVGGGVYVNAGTALFRNVLLAGNVAEVNGGGMYGNAGTTILVNVTVADNVNEGIRQVGGTVSATNSIVWFNTRNDVTGTVSFAHSNIGGADYGGNNIRANPLFVNGYYLDAGSPSTNAGSDTATNLGLAGYAKNADGEAYDATETVNHGWHAMNGVLDLYVSPFGSDTNAGTGPGPSQAFRSVSKALAAARDGTRINVATGAYSQVSGEVFPLTLNDRVGLSIIGTNRQDTALDAAGSVAQRVLTLSAAIRARVQGVTIRGSSPTTDNNYGGGLYITRRSRGVALHDCAVTNNKVGGAHRNGFGAGLAVDATSEAVVSNCTIVGNVNNGSGIRSGYGGGVYNAGTLTVRDSVIRDNSVPTVGSGGGFYNSGIVELRNVLLAGNTAIAQGDGLYNSTGAVVAMNCTVANNAGEGVRLAGGTAGVTNSILWGNGIDSTGGVTLAWSCYSNSTDHVNGGDNIIQDPLFVDTTFFHLQSRAGNYGGGYFDGGAWSRSSATSPCIDAGDPASDYSREPQPNGRQINMGAYGNTEVAALSATPRGTIILMR